jgi:hypothetical protein|tara:strand:+ start:252 stop:464 length:213 start_codon:yes stop_codon:yes gene_type:complete
MDFDKIKKKLQVKEDKYPNIVNVWREYIELKEKNYCTFLNNINNMLDNIDNMPNDLTKENIIFLYLLFST